MRTLRYLIALLALAGVIDSVLALRIHMQDPNAAPPCAVTEMWDCGAVNHSRFAEFPPRSFDEVPGAKGLHIPVAILGIAGYGLIGVLALTGHLWAVLQAAEIGFAFAAFLSFMEAYVLQKWCIYCVWSQAIVAAILVCTIAALVIRHRKTGPGVPDAMTPA